MLRTLHPFVLGLAVALPAIAQDPTPPEATEMGWTGVLDERQFAALHQLKEGEAPELRGAMVEVGDAACYLSLPEGEKPTAAVLVIHEWWGLNDHIKHWADRLAADGYAALAVDLYGGKVAMTRDEALAAMRGIDTEQALTTLRAAYQFLREDERVAAQRRACIGWCFGGGWSLRLAMAAPDLDAAVVYYGRLVTDADQLAGIGAPVLGVFGERDTGIPKESVDAFEQAMQTAGKRLQLLRYDAEHAFANPSSARYHQEHAEAAWAEVRKFLRARLDAEAVASGSFALGDRTAEDVRPAGWQDGGLRTMRVVNFKVGEGTECYVTVLRGAAGGLAANLDRWRAEMGKEPLTDAERDALPRIPMLDTDAVMLQLEGNYRGLSPEQDSAAMLAVVCPLEDETVFVKMLGPKDEVLAQKKAFDAFCRSMR